jgi:hypothetical protein
MIMTLVLLVGPLEGVSSDPPRRFLVLLLLSGAPQAALGSIVKRMTMNDEAAALETSFMAITSFVKNRAGGSSGRWGVRTRRSQLAKVLLVSCDERVEAVVVCSYWVLSMVIVPAATRLVAFAS